MDLQFCSSILFLGLPPKNAIQNPEIGMRAHKEQE
jgi:hypothetical protein